MGDDAGTPAGDELESPSREQVGDFLARLPEDQRKEILAASGHLVSLTTSENYSGQVPDPATAEVYERLAPGSAKRFIDLAEKEQDIRTETMRRSYRLEVMKIFGSISLSVLLLGISAFATWLGNAIIAVPIGLAGVISLFFRLYRSGKSANGP